MPQKYVKTNMETTFTPAENPIMPRHEFFRLVGTSIGAILLSRCMAGCSAQDNPEPTPDPSLKVDFTLRLDEKINENLLSKGGYVIKNDVIVAQTKDGQYVAVSAKCTHLGTELTFKSVENQFYCPSHQSRFNTTGQVVVGPATQPLTQYKVEVNAAAQTVRVYN